ncbi:conserved hypothetical protein [Parafrankia sp. Ea1.12]|nr:conserved hypothetical protein [Parafrankia sp. Ea1.12]
MCRGHRACAGARPARSTAPRQPWSADGLARLAVLGVRAAVRAELAQLETVRVIPPVLARDVVAVLAHLTRHCDLRTNVGGSHGEMPLPVSNSLQAKGPRLTRPLEGDTVCRDPMVAVAGLEPATQRL